MESIRRPSGRRVLLPYEVEMCETLGITPDEYWDFIFAAQEHLREREPEYAHIPDVRNAPVAPILINLAIGIALSAIGYLLSPKPKAPSSQDRRADLAIAGSDGRTRFTRSSNFDSVQELARLGSVVPLIFARHDADAGFGGVRVDSDMLFSQMISSGNNQLLHAVLMLGLANIDRPDFDGLAIGDLLLRDFSEYKSRIYFHNQGRIEDSHKYAKSKLAVPSGSDKDSFSVWWPRRSGYEQYFSGARTPSTKTQFGCYSPIPNGHRFYVPYELVLVIDGSGSDNKEAARRKRYKIAYPFPRMCGVISANNNEVIYKIDGEEKDDSPSEMKPWGAADAISTQNETRINADEVLQENQEYMIGQSICTLIKRPAKVWEPTEKENARYTLRVDEKVGRIPTCGATGENDLDEGGAYPWARGTVQQVAIASLTNNRPCDATEIGIKSEVWRRMVGAANFNGHPTPDTVESYEQDGANITLGSVTKYMKRYSMFKLYARELGADNWIDINGDKPFAVRGTSPTPHYNTIHINHGGTSMHEFRIVPVPGAAFYDQLNAENDVGVYLLDGSMFKKQSDNGAQPTAINTGDYLVYYTGRATSISYEDANNPEWIMNKTEELGRLSRGPISSLSRYTNNKQPLIPTIDLDDKLKGEQYVPTGAKKSLVQRTKNNSGQLVNRFYWEGVRLSGDEDGREITVKQGDKTFRYETGDREQSYREPEYSTPVTEFIVDEASPNDERVRYYTCVYKVPGKNTWRWRWDNETVSERSSKTTDYQYKGDARYKIQDLIGYEEEKWFDGTPEDIYNVKGKDDVNIVDGARLLDNGKYEFHRNDKVIGTSSNRNLKLTDTTRWRATTLVQSARQYQEEKLNQERRVLNDGDGYIADVVYTGYVVKPNRLADGRRDARIFIDGEKLYSGPDPDDAGNRVRVRIGDIAYEGNWDSDDIRVGPEEENGRARCFKLQKYEIQDARYEQWAITFQNAFVTGERYAISRELLEPGQDGHWQIQRYETDRTELETPVESRVDIRSVDNPDRLATARAKLETWSNGGKRWEVIDDGRNYVVDEVVEIGAGGPQATVTGVKGNEDPNTDQEKSWSEMTEKGANYSPLNAICDYFINSTDDSSHANGPEHTVVFCNEIISQSETEVPEYKDLALLGIKITNSKEWTSFNNVSAWIGNGLRIDRLIGGESGLNPTNLFPEIAWALLTDERIGAGEQIGSESVDKNAMTVAARFCEANQFYWDGVIDQKLNLREFIFEQAAYILCDFTIKGGRFALVPSVPYKSDFTINQKGKPEIKALFTDGSMRGMEVTFLSPEERQPFIAVAMYRDETKNGFAETRTIRVKLKGGSDVDPIEEFDMTQFCTNRAQAEIFCKMALKLRSEVDHGIKFETTPQAAMNLEPGEYFRVASQITHTDRFHSGSVDDKGYVNSSIPFSEGGFRVVYWRPGETTTQMANMVLTNDGRTTTARLFGTLWAKVVDNDQSRVYKVETLAYSEDGLCTVTGSHVPLTSSGTMATLDWDDTHFDVEVG